LADKSLSAGFNQDNVSRRQESLRERIDILLQQRLTPRQFHERPANCGTAQRFDALHNLFDTHFLSAMEGVGRIAPRTTQIAARQPYKNTRPARAGSLALDRFEYFGDEHRKLRGIACHYCPLLLIFFPDRFDSQ
jgi:hypothetical protein